MKKTLQDQYLLIKEGKGHKDVFVKEAKHSFPSLIRNAATFTEVVATLKDKNLISENIVGLESINPHQPKTPQSFEVAFSNFLKESQEEEEKAELKKPSKQVEDNLSRGFDTSDKSNTDNLIFDQIMKGYYTEMKDPKNSDKTMEQLKSIVFKNLEKNPIHYTEDGQFGVKGLGYTTEAPGLGEPKEPKGKYKASGYGDLKENIGKNYPDSIEGEYNGFPQKFYGVDLHSFLVDMLDISNSEDDFLRKVIMGITNDTNSISLSDEQKLRRWYAKNSIESLKESKLRKVIRESIEKELATINKEAEMEILDTKLEKIEAAIEKRQSQLTKLDEDEDMKALTDKTKVKQIQKDIKSLEKAKSKIEKQLSKKDKPAKSEIIDEDEPIGEAIDDKKLDDTTKSLDVINKTVDDISKKTTEMFENESDLPQDIINQVVEKFADGGGDSDLIYSIAASYPNYEEEIIEFLEGYDLGLDYDI
jgi:hypothetical protein